MAYYRWRNQYGGLKADDAEALVTPEALDLLVGHDSALGARLVIRAMAA